MHSLILYFTVMVDNTDLTLQTVNFSNILLRLLLLGGVIICNKIVIQFGKVSVIYHSNQILDICFLVLKLFLSMLTFTKKCVNSFSLDCNLMKQEITRIKSRPFRVLFYLCNRLDRPLPLEKDS